MLSIPRENHAALWALALLLLACSRAEFPRNPSWEPAPKNMPVVRDRKQALRYLQQSRLLWEQWRRDRWNPDDSEYSYVRALQRDEQTVEFTIIGVVKDKVAARVLVIASIDELEEPEPPLPERGPDETPPRPGLYLAWVESASNLNAHPGGAPPKTMEELYRLCERDVLGKRPDLDAELLFDPDGILMHCGFAAENCPDCPRVSIQSYGPMSVSNIPADVLKTPGLWLCRDFNGVFPPFAMPATRVGNLCQPVQWRCLSNLRHTTLAHPCVPDAELVDTELISLEMVCAIDPEACTFLMLRHADWRSTSMYGGYWFRAREPTFWEIGKRAPHAPWSFPAIESDGHSADRKQFRVNPTLQRPSAPNSARARPTQRN